MSTAQDERLADLARPYLVVATVAAVMWFSEGVDLVLPGSPLDRWGIRPRTLRGVVGIPLAPFLHGSLRHLLSNTVPFLLLGGAIAAGGVGRWARVTVIVALTSGAGVWLFGRPGTIHVGASGVVFGYLTYLVARGVIARHTMWLVGGAIALFVYGGMLWGLLPTPGVSWSGHAFGAIGGVLAAWALHRPAPEPEVATRS